MSSCLLDSYSYILEKNVFSLVVMHPYPTLSTILLLSFDFKKMKCFLCVCACVQSRSANIRFSYDAQLWKFQPHIDALGDLQVFALFSIQRVALHCIFHEDSLPTSYPYPPDLVLEAPTLVELRWPKIEGKVRQGSSIGTWRLHKVLKQKKSSDPQYDIAC